MAENIARCITLSREGLRTEELAQNVDRLGNTPDAAKKYLQAATTLNYAAAMCPIEKASAAASDLAKTADSFASSVCSDSAAKAAILYRQACKQLSEAAASCPAEHPDRLALQEHVSEIEVRALYLESLGDAPITIPIEDHIGSITLALELPGAAAEAEVVVAQAPESKDVVSSADTTPSVAVAPDANAEIPTQGGGYQNEAPAILTEPSPASQAHSVASPTEPAPSVPAVKVDFLERAIDKERNAHDLEKRGQREQALSMFTDCLQLYGYVQKKEQNPRVKQTVRDRMAEVMDHAEVLKAQLLLG